MNETGVRACDGYIVTCQALVDGRTLQGAVVEIDEDGGAIVEHKGTPIDIRRTNAEQDVLIGTAFEEELAVLNLGAVDVGS